MYFVKAFLCKCICVSSFCVEKLWRAMVFFGARDFSLTVRAFWRAEELRWVENFEEMRKVDQCSDERKTVEKNLLRWHVRRDVMRWEELRHEVGWGEKSSDEMRWDEVWSVKCEAQAAKSAVWSVKKRFAWRALQSDRSQVMLSDNDSATGSHSTHPQAWLARSACKFYR